MFGLFVRGADEYHAGMDPPGERRHDRRLLAPVDGCCARENPGGLVLKLAFEPEATPWCLQTASSARSCCRSGSASPRRCPSAQRKSSCVTTGMLAYACCART